ncbi:Pimeloyl-ACP methyl ester carboxylesterase [Ornithinimicrobium cerasi]|uniref:Pimeloyl-ACP methyl ester carboxylesterase n=2 Tax=Ornithinimicrobium cerasi TaxID=2248773 RepID=A0A285VNU3_9MICO|nr:Pimeloyl-ACP methyl ester carboxylesterase [Ornithinimicrobium cerasi]
MTEASSRAVETPGATIVYDVQGPLPPADDRPPLLMIGQPMDASGFRTLASFFPDRTVVTYDPRGLGRSTRSDGRDDNDPRQHADDLHRLVAALDVGPVEVFGSSGGAVDGLALVEAHPEDVRVLVAHEPPLTHLLPDADAVRRAEQDISSAYQDAGFGHGMARFIAYTSWEGELTGEFFDRPAPDPAAFGLPSEDDGSRGDPLLSGASESVTAWTPDVDALVASGVRLVVAAGEESARQVTGRSAQALAERLGLPLTMFPSHHGGFLGPELGWPGQPEAFAARLRSVLDGPVP